MASDFYEENIQASSTTTGEVTVFMAAARANATGTEADTMASANAATASTSDAATEAIPGATSGTVSRVTTGASSRREYHRFIIHSKQQLQQSMSDHLHVSMELLNIDW